MTRSSQKANSSANLGASEAAANLKDSVAVTEGFGAVNKG